MMGKEGVVVSENAKLGKNTRVWHYSQIRENARIGDNCIIGKNVYIDHDVVIGDNVKIQNNCSIYYMTTLEDGVFVGPHVVFTNDKNPRAIDSKGNLKKESDWQHGKILVKKGASIGAGSIILPNVTLGEFSMVGAASLLTKDVQPYNLVFGNPAKFQGYVCKCGEKVVAIGEKGKEVILKCRKCGEKITTKANDSNC